MKLPGSVFVGIALLLSPVAVGAAVLTVGVDPPSSSTWPAGTTFTGDVESFTSVTSDPLGPFSGLSTHFRGYDPAAGGSTEQWPATPWRHLVVRYFLHFDEPVSIQSIGFKGAAFNGSLFRLLDAGGGELWSVEHPVGGNIYQDFAYSMPAFVGQSFALEEWEGSTWWRFREEIDIAVAPSAVPEPSSALLLLSGSLALTAWRRGARRP